MGVASGSTGVAEKTRFIKNKNAMALAHVRRDFKKTDVNIPILLCLSQLWLINLEMAKIAYMLSIQIGYIEKTNCD